MSWARNTEADLAGYRVYFGDSALVLILLQDVGLTQTPLTPSVRIQDFPSYGAKVWAVTAYDNSNNNSPFSNAVNKAIAPKLFPLVWTGA